MADQPSTSQSTPSCGASGEIELQSQPNTADVVNVEIANEIYAEISPVPASFDPLYSNTADGEQTNIPSLYGEVSQIPPGCELCENMRSSCRRIMDSFYLMAKRSANYEEIKEENSSLRRQLGDTNKFVEDRLKDVFSLQTELSNLRVDAGLAKQREEDLLKQIQILEVKAKESREHAHAANIWREKYSRSVEVAEQLQNKRLEIDKKLRDVIEIATSNKKKKEDFEQQAESLKKEKKELTTYNTQCRKALPRLFQILDDIVNDSMELPLLLSKKIEKVRMMSSRAVLLNLKEVSDTGSDDDALELESLLNVSASTSVMNEDRMFNQSFNSVKEVSKPSSSSTFVNQEAINASARRSHFGAPHSKAPPKFKHISKPDYDRTPVPHSPAKYSPTTPVPVFSQPDNKQPSAVVNTIHGKKGKTIREIQEEQRFKGSVKERVAEMKRLKELEKAKDPRFETSPSTPTFSPVTPRTDTHCGSLGRTPVSAPVSRLVAKKPPSMSESFGDDLDFEDIGISFPSFDPPEQSSELLPAADTTTTCDGVLSSLADDLNMSVSDVGSVGDAQDIIERTAEEVVENVVEDMLTGVEASTSSEQPVVTGSHLSLEEGFKHPPADVQKEENQTLIPVSGPLLEMRSMESEEKDGESPNLPANTVASPEQLPIQGSSTAVCEESADTDVDSSKTTEPIPMAESLTEHERIGPSLVCTVKEVQRVVPESSILSTSIQETQAQKDRSESAMPIPTESKHAKARNSPAKLSEMNSQPSGPAEPSLSEETVVSKLVKQPEASCSSELISVSSQSEVQPPPGTMIDMLLSFSETTPVVTQKSKTSIVSSSAEAPRAVPTVKANVEVPKVVPIVESHAEATKAVHIVRSNSEAPEAVLPVKSNADAQKVVPIVKSNAEAPKAVPVVRSNDEAPKVVSIVKSNTEVQNAVHILKSNAEVRKVVPTVKTNADFPKLVPPPQKKTKMDSVVREASSLANGSPQSVETCLKSKWADGAKRALDIMHRINQELQPVLDSIPLSPRIKQSLEYPATPSAPVTPGTPEAPVVPVALESPGPIHTSSIAGNSMSGQRIARSKSIRVEVQKKCDISRNGTAGDMASPTENKRISRTTPCFPISKTPKMVVDKLEQKGSSSVPKTMRTNLAAAESFSITGSEPVSRDEIENEDESIATRLRRRAVLSIAEPQKIIAVPNPSVVPNTKTGESLLKGLKKDQKKLESPAPQKLEPRAVKNAAPTNLNPDTEISSGLFSGLRKNTRTRVTASKKSTDISISDDSSKQVSLEDQTVPLKARIQGSAKISSNTHNDETDSESDLEIADVSEEDQTNCSELAQTANDNVEATTETSPSVSEEVAMNFSSSEETIVSPQVSADKKNITVVEHVISEEEKVPEEKISESSTGQTTALEKESPSLPVPQSSVTVLPTCGTDLNMTLTDDETEELALEIDDEVKDEPVNVSMTGELEQPVGSPPRTSRTRKNSTPKKEAKTPKTSPRKKAVSNPKSEQAPTPSFSKPASRSVQRSNRKALSSAVPSGSGEEDLAKPVTITKKAPARPSKIYDISLLNKFTQSLGRGGRLLSTRSKGANTTTTREKKANPREPIMLDIPKAPVVRQAADRKGLKRVTAPSLTIPVAKRGKRSQDTKVERTETDIAKEFFLNAGLYLINMRTSKDNAVASVIETYLSEEQVASIKQLSVEDLGSVLVEIVYNMKNVDLFHQVKLSFQERSIKEIRNKEEEHVLELAYLLANGNIFITFVRSLVQRIIAQDTINPNQCASYARLMSHALLFDCSNVEEDLRASEEERTRLVRTFFNTIFWKHKSCISHALIFWLIGKSWELLTFLAEDLTLRKQIIAHVEKYERDIIQWAWASRFGETSAKSVIPDDVVSRLEEWIAEERMNIQELIPTETVFQLEDSSARISPEVAKSLRIQAVLYNSSNLPLDLYDRHMNQCTSLFQSSLDDLIVSLSSGDTSTLFADTTNTRGRSLTAVKVHELCVNIKSFESIIGHSLLERESTKYRRSLDIVSRTLNNIRFIRNTLREDPDIPFSKLLSSVINTYITLAQTFTSHII